MNTMLEKIDAAGARLFVEDGKLGLVGELPEDLKNYVHEHIHEFTEYLSWDQEEGVRLIRKALSYLAERYDFDADNPEDGQLHWHIDLAFEMKDMWVLRFAVKRWVISWLHAIKAASEVAA
jgi:hypothetical protein